METKRIEISDIRPNENNPRSDFGDLDMLWDTFQFNSENPGEPVNPIVVVQDGSIYRIVDGERRYRAMRDHGQESCMAVVCSGYDDMAQAVQMLATDDKLSLTPEEAGKGIQMMLLLGVDETKVANVSHAPVDEVKTVSSFISNRKVTGSAYQASFEQLLAAAEVDEYDRDVADEILNSRNWQKPYGDFMHNRRIQDEYDSYIQAAQEAGFEIIEGEYDRDDYGNIHYIYSVENFSELYEKGYRYAGIELNSWGVTANVFTPKGQEPTMTADEQEEDEERARLAAKQDEYEAKFEKLRAAVAQFYIAYHDNPDINLKLENMAERALFGYGDDEDGELGYQILQFSDITGWTMPARKEIPDWAKAYAFESIYSFTEPGYLVSKALTQGVRNLDDWAADRAVSDANNLCAIINGFIAAGFEPLDWIDDLMNEVSALATYRKHGDDE